MLKIASFIFLFIIIFFTNCKNASQENKTTTQYFDTFQLHTFLEQHLIEKNQQNDIKAFYQQRDNAFVWLNDSGLNEYAKSFIELLSNEDSLQKTNNATSKQKFQKLYSTISSNTKFNIKDSATKAFEFLLTTIFLDYAQQHWEGISEEKIKQSGWFITKNNISATQRLNIFLKNDISKNPSYLPVNRQYALLNDYFKKYIAIEKKGGWKNWTSNIKGFKKEDSSATISLIKQQLVLQEDLVTNDNTNVFNDALEVAVKKFQKRFGLNEDGIITGKTLIEMNIPLRQRIQQLMVNIERSKWMPIEQQGDYLAVNIPDFKLLVYNNNKLEWSCNVVVGKSQISSNTIIFNDSLENIVFSPYWNLPSSIMFKETLPAMSRNGQYLNNHNMEIINNNEQIIAQSQIKQSQLGKNFPYMIRQKPGKNNALGLVKFLFPNNYNIYMHDTPEKSLFEESNRMFSHGCIRVKEPVKLAKFLLRKDTSWTDEKISNAMNSGKEIYVKMKNKVPVYIAYFTAWVDRAGNLNYRDDIYHHDVKMKQLIF
ncbi:MAG: L,D-transpeptidase family protein [Bacteroidetes bacterium]|nr:L,D-transpeptidase family protein [Bacteroidota bacterium]